ncbi:MAG TPA: urease accessory protein UreD [Rugosimonospora sp.]|nr:urease accessory protein UreD [Rugosimonospora sp.]
MRAHARIVAEPADPEGTRFAVLASQPPLVLRRTGPDEVHLVGGAAGPLGGDDLLLSIEVRAGARLRVRTAAASVALPGRDGSASRLRVCASVAGSLEWLPEPLVAARGCRHRVVSTVELSGDASLRWREELVCGRHAEPAGDATVSTRVMLDGRALLCQELSVGPGAPGWDGPAVLGGARAVGSLLVVCPSWNADGPPGVRVLGPGAALMPLAGPAVLASVTGPDAHEVRRQLDAAAALLAPRDPASVA